MEVMRAIVRLCVAGKQLSVFHCSYVGHVTFCGIGENRNKWSLIEAENEGAGRCVLLSLFETLQTSCAENGFVP